MAKATTTKVTKEEIDAVVLNENNTVFSAQNSDLPESPIKKPTEKVGYVPHSEYVSRLKKHPELIEKWFKPFGYVRHEFDENKAVVLCNEFIVAFEDFDLILEELCAGDYMQNLFGNASDSKFDFDEFKQACVALDTTPAQGLEEYLAIKLSELYPSSYPAARKEYKERVAKRAFKDFEKTSKEPQVVELVRELKNKQNMNIEATHSRGHFGTYNKPE